VVDSRLDGDTRVVTFFTGAVARETLIDSDDQQRRLVWSVTESRLGFAHHNASAQVFAEPGGATRFVWIADVLPHDVAAPVAELMDRAIEVIKRTLEARPV
jgi:hypothetical protein